MPDASLSSSVRHSTIDTRHSTADHHGVLERIEDYEVWINDGPNFRVLCKDIFTRRIYHFDCQRGDPLILDCGSNIGISILYFKHVYPAARIVAFEPDPTIVPYLRDNLERNGFTDVKIIEAALSARAEPQTLYSDGKYSSALADHKPADSAADSLCFGVSCVRLRDCRSCLESFSDAYSFTNAMSV